MAWRTLGEDRSEIIRVATPQLTDWSSAYVRAFTKWKFAV